MCAKFLELMPVVTSAICDCQNEFDLAPPSGLIPIIERYIAAFKPFYDLTQLVQRMICFDDLLLCLTISVKVLENIFHVPAFSLAGLCGCWPSSKPCSCMQHKRGTVRWLILQR